MTSNENEEEEAASGTRGRPNSFWAEQRERGDTYSGAFRGVPTPHGGQQTVTAADLKGAGHLCWCGEPYDHDWAGKSGGAKHPKGTSVTTMTEHQRIDRRQLRAYHRDLQEVIVAAVNQYGVRFKLAASHIILYPNDGSDQYRIAARNNERMVKPARDWFAKHVLGADLIAAAEGKGIHPLIKDGNVIADDLERREELERKEAKRQAAIEQELKDEKERELLATQAEILRLAKVKNSEEHPVPTAPKVDPKRSGGMVSTAETPRLWVPHLVDKGKATEHESDIFETDGTTIRCKECVGGEHHYETTQPRGLGGHRRMWHTDRTNMYDDVAQAKKSDSLKATHLRNKVDEAIDLLIKATGYEGDTALIQKLEREVERLRQENKELRANCVEVEKAKRRADDAEARLALIQEAFKA